MRVAEGGGGRGIGEFGGERGGGVEREGGRGESEGEETTEVWKIEEE